MTKEVGPIRSGGFDPGGCLLLLFVVLLLIALPVLLKALGVVLALFVLVVTAAVLHGTVQGRGGWRALFRRTWRRVTAPFRTGG